MQVLYISQKPAFPVVDGGSFAMNRFFLDLNEVIETEIDYLSITTKKHPISFDSIPSHITKKTRYTLLNWIRPLKLSHYSWAFSPHYRITFCVINKKNLSIKLKR